MKTRIVVSTFAFIVGLYGIPSMASDFFNERGQEWMNASQTSTPYNRDDSSLASQGPFASSWGSGKTPSLNTKVSPSSSLTTEKSCDLTPRVGWNNGSNPIC
ncbi:MAG: hypothetical protein U1F42_10295 [Candidatus Competibacteraceae bacterium]